MFFILSQISCIKLYINYFVLCSYGKTTLLTHIAERKIRIPANIDVLLCEQGEFRKYSYFLLVHDNIELFLSLVLLAIFMAGMLVFLVTLYTVSNYKSL